MRNGEVSREREGWVGDLIARRLSRRDVLKMGTSALAIAVSGGGSVLIGAGPAHAAPASFREVAGGVDERHHVAEGYEADILIRWGDPLFPDLPTFDPAKLTGAGQARRFGYNNDYVAFFPLEGTPDRALLCVNHEYTNRDVMFPGMGGLPRSDFSRVTRAHVDVEMAAHGISVVELAREGGRWKPVVPSRFNRRVTASTEIAIDGAAAGHARLRTKADPTGTRVNGTINNCAGGQTPWGTYLAGEENFHGYFWTDAKGADGKPSLKGHGGAQAASYKRYGIPGAWYNWGQHDERFNVDKEPNEPNRFGWIVEVDPLDPEAPPVKHTALGRFRHEGAETILSKDGRAIVYLGDDAPNEFIYRFVSASRMRPGDKAHNARLLSEGTLSVARFNGDGTLDWLPLVHGIGPLTAANGFASQADVLIDARLAASLLGATPMDRPEDVQPHPTNGRAYAMLTNNAKRTMAEVDKANPRAANLHGHILEMTAPEGDHAAARFGWDILVLCGDPGDAATGARWNAATTADGWFSSPDNCAFDVDGRLWVATDQGSAWTRTGKADGFYAVDTDGPERGRSRLFFRCPVGAEMTGPCFTPDGTTLFLAVQHPGLDGVKGWKPFGRATTFEDPATRWPDFAPGMPPRPSVVMIRKKDGGRIGS